MKTAKTSENKKMKNFAIGYCNGAESVVDYWRSEEQGESRVNQNRKYQFRDKIFLEADFVNWYLTRSASRFFGGYHRLSRIKNERWHEVPAMNTNEMMNNAVKVTVNRAIAMREGNALRKQGKTHSEALKIGYKVARIYALFAAGAIAAITFVKKDGTIRNAKALPARAGEYLLTGTGTHATPKANILFIDAEIGEFRSLIKANLLTVA